MKELITKITSLSTQGRNFFRERKASKGVVKQLLKVLES